MGYRITAGAGLGYVAYETPTGRLAVDASVTGVFEELDGREQQNPAFGWGPNLNQYIVPDVLEAFHQHSILAVADSDRGQIFDSSTGPRMHVSEHLDATATVDVRYETEPAPGRDKADTPTRSALASASRCARGWDTERTRPGRQCLRAMPGLAMLQFAML